MQTTLNESNDSVVGKTTRKRRSALIPTIGVVGFVAIAILSAPGASRRVESESRQKSKPTRRSPRHEGSRSWKELP